ncbi:MAG: hypothetical protein RR448_00270 [Niameybacter sp.]|uniref:hypothetical protein n=1 Tax=Niameybacter sp. TaxID=2033640 RepID=UPI002FCA2CE9
MDSQALSHQQIHSLFEELVITKRKQRMIEERLLQILASPVQRKWMHERVQDQYKHERMIQDITKEYLHEEIKIDPFKHNITISHSAQQELNNRLEAVARNIQLMAHISQPIEDFKLYKMINNMLSDEYIYQTRLVKMLTEK